MYGLSHTEQHIQRDQLRRQLVFGTTALKNSKSQNQELEMLLYGTHCFSWLHRALPACERMLLAKLFLGSHLWGQ